MEQVPDSFPALFAGYSVIWGLLVLYVIFLGKKLYKLEKYCTDKQDK